jgi:uncharacterized membrane protein
VGAGVSTAGVSTAGLRRLYPAAVRSERGLDRFITFLDAVVAIAITLLVLPLAEVIVGTDPPPDAADVFTQNGARFFAFLLSFAVISRLWLAHHRLVEWVGAYDTAFLWLNFGWALTIVFLPFATQLTSAYLAEDRLALGVYLGNLALSSVFLSLVATLVWRRPGLRREAVAAADAVPWTALATTAVLVLALVVGVAFPGVNYFALLLLFLTSPVERLLRRISLRSRQT